MLWRRVSSTFTPRLMPQQSDCAS